MMNRYVLLALVSAGITASVGLGARAWASTAWTRTVDGSACTVATTGTYHCPFVSDTLNGTFGGAGGNGGVTHIYADATCPNPQGNVFVTACAHTYDNLAGSCGTTVNGLCNGATTVDVPASLWTGTGSQWDYFYVSIDTWGPVKIIGIAANGID